FEELDASRQESGVRAKAEGPGLAWWVYQDCEFENVVWHNGGTEGYRSALYMLPERGVAVIVLTNLSDGDPDHIARAALHTLAKSGGLTPRSIQPAKGLEAAATKVAGLFAAWDGKVYESLFSPGFRAAIPAAELKRDLSDVHEKHGSCSYVGIHDL